MHLWKRESQRFSFTFIMMLRGARLLHVLWYLARAVKWIMVSLTRIKLWHRGDIHSTHHTFAQHLTRSKKPKITILSPFTHPYVIPNPCDLRRRMLIRISRQIVSQYNRNRWPSDISFEIFQVFCRHTLICKEQTGKHTSVALWTFILGWTYLLKSHCALIKMSLD